MLALANYRGYDINNYESITNPVQQEILKTIAEFTDEDQNTIPVGTDGCGAPIYLLPIYKIALSYARLVMYSKSKESPYHHSCKTVFDSMNQFPEMIAGNYEFCTELLHVTNGKLIGKAGCEAVYCLGIKEGNLGICIKIADGNKRAVYPVVVQILKELGILSDKEYSGLRHWHTIDLRNNINKIIGKILPVFNMEKPIENRQLIGKKFTHLFPDTIFNSRQF